MSSSLIDGTIFGRTQRPVYAGLQAMNMQNVLVPADSMEQHAEAAASLLRALANPHRLMVLCCLAEGELCVSDINARIPLAQSALSQHLAVLRRDDLVTTRRVSQTIYYALKPGPALDIIAVLHRHFCAE